MKRAQAYHPIETEAIIHLVQSGLQWKQIARAIGRDVDSTSLRQHVERVAPELLKSHSYPQAVTLHRGRVSGYVDGRKNEKQASA
jgi:hypothetical protein